MDQRNKASWQYTFDELTNLIWRVDHCNVDNIENGEYASTEWRDLLYESGYKVIQHKPGQQINRTKDHL